MLIAKAIALLLLPPGILLLLIIFGLLGWRRRWGRGVVAVALLSLLLLSLGPVKDRLIRPLEYQYSTLDAAQVHASDTIVVLGGGVNGRSLEYGGEDFLSESALMRVVFALHLAKMSGADVWVSGGSPLHKEQQPEGEIMRRWLINQGIPSTRVHAENRANNTWQNAQFLQPLLTAAGVQRVILVTTAWHIPRAVWSFEQAGIVVVPAPCDYSSSQRPYTVLDWLPDANVLARSTMALHEYLGLLYYRLYYGVKNRV